MYIALIAKALPKLIKLTAHMKWSILFYLKWCLALTDIKLAHSWNRNILGHICRQEDENAIKCHSHYCEFAFGTIQVDIGHVYLFFRPQKNGYTRFYETTHQVSLTSMGHKADIFVLTVYQS